MTGSEAAEAPAGAAAPMTPGSAKPAPTEEAHSSQAPAGAAAPLTPGSATPHSEPVLEVQGLSVRFDGFAALTDVDLTVSRGEIRFLIGPNGAGKTTLVDCITGLTRPTEGSVRFEGRELVGMREHRRVRLGVGRTFQTPTVFESLTVLENLDLAEAFRRRFPTLLRQRHGVSDAVAATLEGVGLADQAFRPAGVLSHGQKQWLEIGMLLVQKPQLLLLDELVAGMTPAERQATGELLQSLARDHTLLVIEHDMAFLRRFATAVTVLHEGKILSEGSVEAVQSDPKVREVYLGRSRDERSGAPPRESAEPAASASAEVGS
jgi:urea transport system ATP-binding protein